MTITRILPGLVLLAAVAEPATAQYGFSGSRYKGVVPSVMPAGAEEPAIPPIPPMPPGRPPAAVRSLEQMTMPTPPGEVASPADPVGTLSAPPFAVSPGFGPGQVPGYPPGSYPSPYYTDGPGCCGPLGADGRIGYELHAYTGVNIVFGEGLPQFLNAGWMTGGGARTLFFDATHTTAWTFDLGASYTYNRGKGADEPTFLFLRTPAVQDQFTGVLTPQPDRLVFTAIRGVHRTSFNFALGRDWWLWGAGNTGGCVERNARVGGWVGGRYGTSHVDQVPLDEVNGYSRRQNVFHGVYVGGHATIDIPMGGWIWFGGMRVEYGHDWTNLTPPLEGNIHNVNILLTAGFRY